jgi:hypothetical protein
MKTKPSINNINNEKHITPHFINQRRLISQKEIYRISSTRQKENRTISGWNKKASIGETLWDNAVYLIILVMFIIIMLGHVWLQMNGAEIWSQYYSKEISKVINLAQPNDEITLDVHKATEIAVDHNINQDEIFEFDNAKNEICIKLTHNRKTCYSYFNQVDIVNYRVQPTLDTNILTLKIIEKQ